MNLLQNKTALITGANRGIGKAIALMFASEGCNVAFTDLERNDAMESLEKELSALSVTAKGYASNAANFNDAQNVVNQVVADFGRIDILVNNAGITKDSALKRMTEEQWDAVINVNLKSVFSMTKAVQPIMWKQGEGSIISLSSIVGIAGNANQANYSASKAGIIGFTKSVAKELGIRNIRCNAVAPGFIMTDMTAQLPEALLEEWKKRIPMHRAGSVDEVAKVCVFLASDLASYVTGQVIPICGGLQI
ncbi:MAG: 3-oxoacyl-[Bacteroidales bacterium]|jgi:3-oxoacyl-[acyl-carrier protein] reductase|nr:3-oxoacyl-[acyl-carrier-protein] reductase [Bacteroidales bacterium]MBP5723927.1 3-oxoacyl-[acyl-carrier-protein] reductase [Bacteroidales bacterium]MBQ3675997.1 3-oxoacyl-[acyl-carrier-protein] reductase [Bacteroidales bacterium]MBQ4214649.1 3-oxoacyl-[acyl-carrier-protein] reductase [Bacteroidales bacterium]MBR4497895.1 3-oxoacyl-[acyl-carrier-protein] reductase [Bacteroidales bacterium]